MKSNSISSAPVQTHHSRLALKTPRNVLSHTQPDFAQPWNMWERPLTAGTDCREIAAFVRQNLGGGNGEEPEGVQDQAVVSAVRQGYTCTGISGERWKGSFTAGRPWYRSRCEWSFRPGSVLASPGSWQHAGAHPMQAALFSFPVPISVEFPCSSHARVGVFFLFFLSCWFSDCRLAGDSKGLRNAGDCVSLRLIHHNNNTHTHMLSKLILSNINLVTRVFMKSSVKRVYRCEVSF